MKYQLNAIANLVIDGVHIAAGETIAVLDTDFDPSNIFSACWFGDAKPIATTSPTSEIRQVRRATLTAADVVPPSQPEPATIDADVIDAAEENAPASITEGQALADESELKAHGEPIHNPFDGLAPRIADALLAAGFESRDAVAEVAAAGPDAFLDYDGIGKSAAKKIIAWLGSE